jgi:predicted membrane-bound spermidine synthase
VTLYLRVAVFLSGFGVLAAEVVAPRLLAPAFGTSQLVWTNVIGTILVALALGSWLGGRLADRGPSERGFGWLLVSGGCLTALVPFLARPLLADAMQALSEQCVGSYLASLGASSLLFAPPVLALGAAAPYAIRLAGAGRADLGRVAGDLAALGALGSIVGTFAASLVLLPLLGSRTTLLTSGAVLASAGALRALRPKGALVAVLAFVLLGLSYREPIRRDPGQVFEAETLYGYLQVRRNAAGWAWLLTNESVSHQSVWPGEGIVTGGAWDQLSLAPALTGQPTHELRVLIVGLAGGTVARQIQQAYAPTTRVFVHGVELDPAMVEAGRMYLGLGSLPDVQIDIGDARVAVESLDELFDVIVIDVFRGLYLPAHLVTREFFDACRRKLRPGGVLAMNAATPLDSGRVLGALGSTLQAVFENVRFMRLPAGGPVASTVLFASDAALEAPRPERIPEPLRSVGIQLHPIETAARHRRVLSDDHAPVEWLTDLALIEALGATDAAR